MRTPIPVNPDVLRWARVSLNLPVEEVARRMKKKVADIEAWESGETSPTYVQLETLAYKIYRRPLALFFFPEPPEEETIAQSFRTLPADELQRIPPRIHYLLRQARVLQLNLAELYDGVNPAERKIWHDLDFAPTVAATDMAEQVRAYLGIELAQQQSWNSTVFLYSRTPSTHRARGKQMRGTALFPASACMIQTSPSSTSTITKPRPGRSLPCSMSWPIC